MARGEFAPVLLVHLGTPEDGATFFDERWPEARAVSDENEEFYEAFGLKQASIGQLISPRVWLEGFKAVRNGVGKPVGNPMRMSGWFLIDEGSIAWSHIHEHAGAPLQFEECDAAYRALRKGSYA